MKDLLNHKGKLGLLALGGVAGIGYCGYANHGGPAPYQRCDGEWRDDIRCGIARNRG